MQSKVNILFTELMKQSIVNNQSEKKQFFVSNEDKKNSRRNGRSIFRNGRSIFQSLVWLEDLLNSWLAYTELDLSRS